MPVYAVKRGRTTGLFATWPECLAQVGGFSGAEYKKFATQDEANRWLGLTPQPEAVEALPETAPQLTHGTTIYTDGACSGNPGPGGFAAVVIHNGKRTEISGAEAQTTNNRAELQAAIIGLNQLEEPQTVTVITDSLYVIEGITGQKKTQKNTDLWAKLKQVAAPHTIEWQWVKGHAGNPDNERCDELARAAIRLVQ